MRHNTTRVITRARINAKGDDMSQRQKISYERSVVRRYDFNATLKLSIDCFAGALKQICFTTHMPFLLPIQWHQSTEGRHVKYHSSKNNIKATVHYYWVSKSIFVQSANDCNTRTCFEATALWHSTNALWWWLLFIFALSIYTYTQYTQKASFVSSKLKCSDVGIGTAEEEMDNHHLTRPHQPEPHTSGRRGSRRLEKKNPCGWPPHLRDTQPEGERERQSIILTAIFHEKLS